MLHVFRSPDPARIAYTSSLTVNIFPYGQAVNIQLQDSDLAPPLVPDERRRRHGAVFTPPLLAAWAAALAAELLPSSRPVAVDFGCGDGALLKAFAEVEREASLRGVELHSPSAAKAEATLRSKDTSILHDDVLAPVGYSCHNGTLSDYWREQLGAVPDAVIMNPPWGASLSANPASLGKAGLTLATGQFDSYDLFCELAVQVLSRNGAYVFIVPDSILLPEHTPLRKLLVEETSIFLIARLGEGVFRGVFRGCVIVAGTKGVPPEHHSVECLRLTKKERLAIATGDDIAACRSKLAHSVPQRRFQASKDYRFDIDVTTSDGGIHKIAKTPSVWSNSVTSRRGVELSKHGHVIVCSGCALASPKPRASPASCKHCGLPFDLTQSYSIVSHAPDLDGEWMPMIVGEDVVRYSAKPSRRIRVGVAGINYKAPTPPGVERLLVRKTGIGLNVALDDSGAFTNQVVFEYRPRREFRDFNYLHYLLGVLCSRVMFAYHLKTSGELEWRSHPYITQKSIASLPVPVPQEGSQGWQQAKAIAEAVNAHLLTGTNDLVVEQLVAGLFDLGATEIAELLKVFDSAADLEAIKRMRVPPEIRIDPVKV